MSSEQSGDKGRKAADASSEPDAGDDLDALAGTLGSLPPPEGDEGEVDLRALSALSLRSSSVVESRDAGVLRLDGALDALSASPSPAPSSPAVVMESTDASSWSSRPPPARRASWGTPLVIGLSLGIGVAGLAFGLSQMRAPEPVAASVTAPLEATPTSQVTGATPAAAAPTVAPAAPQPPAAAPAAEGELEATVIEPTPAEIGAARGLAPNARPAVRAATTANRVDSAPPIVLGSPAASASTPAASGAAPVLALRPAGEETTAPAAAPAAATPTQAAAKRGSSVDDLLDQALASPERREAMRKEEAATQVQDSLPETPSREDVTKAMTTMLPAISGCAMGHSGLATATIVVRGDGRVASAEVAGAPFAGTASGRCMEGVIRRATFPRFRQPIFRIKFPLSIR